MNQTVDSLMTDRARLQGEVEKMRAEMEQLREKCRQTDAENVQLIERIGNIEHQQVCMWVWVGACQCVAVNMCVCWCCCACVGVYECEFNCMFVCVFRCVTFRMVWQCALCFMCICVYVQRVPVNVCLGMFELFGCIHIPHLSESEYTHAHA